MPKHKELLSEALRPQRLSHLTLPQTQIERLQQMIVSGSIMNMVFYGKPGIGKTSAARILIKELGAQENSIEINGSSTTGVEFVRDNIESFARSVSLLKGPKVCFIDESDYLSKQAQGALRYVIENSSHRVRYIFTANDRSKLIPAIQSRMLMICFDVLGPDVPEVLSRLVQRYEHALSKVGVAFDNQRLRQLVGIYFPDLRSMANAIEWEFGHANLEQGENTQ
jgi:DNA polymerase III delta prime subunit